MLECRSLLCLIPFDYRSMSSSYDASDIEVLSGLEPVRKRPGMYTDTARPNHLAQEVIDNSVDEAIAGHASMIDVTLFKDGSLQVVDDDEIMMITNGGKIIRTNMQNVRVIGRNTQGVNLFRLAEGEKVVGMDRMAEPTGEVEGADNGAEGTAEE